MLTNTWYCQMFQFCPSDECEIHLSKYLICIPLITGEKHLFINLLATQESSSVNYLGLFFCCIVFFFLFLKKLICSSFYITVSNLCQLSVLQIFSLSVRLVFSFCFMVSVHENKFLILVPNLSIFYNLCFFWCLSIYLFIFIYGCVGSSFLCEGSL